MSGKIDSSQHTGIPVVRDRTRTQSESVETIVSRMRSKEVFIPDYQRDSDQWTSRKKSLFIESLINNLTIPAFFFCENDNGSMEVVDGQQRLMAIFEFIEHEFKISADQTIDFLMPQANQYMGKKYSQLTEDLQKIIRHYPLTIIFLPQSMPLSIRLEVFRRINEGGTPLTGQDIRLAYYSQSKAVSFIRLCGLHNESQSSIRMIESAKKIGIDNPWDRVPAAKKEWNSWWKDKAKANGQTPSLMFLWYLICRERHSLDDMCKDPKRTMHLNIICRGTTEEVLDIYCAQLESQENKVGAVPPIFLLSDNFDDYFLPFAKWIYSILHKNLPGVNVSNYKQLALLIACATELGREPESFNDEQWNLIGNFIRKPREASRDILGSGDAYPEPKGRWNGHKGQKQQCDKTIDIVRRII